MAKKNKNKDFPTLAVELEGKVQIYQVRAPKFQLKGKIFSADEVCKNPQDYQEVIAALVEKKVGFLKLAESKNTIPAGDPSDKWTNQQLQAWMDQEGIEYSPDDKKADLLNKIKGGQ